MSRTAKRRPSRVLAVLIVLALALVGLALLRTQAQPAAGAGGADCVTLCALPGQGHGGHPGTGQPAPVRADDDFPSLLPRSELPAEAVPAERYVPVTLRIAGGEDGPTELK